MVLVVHDGCCSLRFESPLQVVVLMVLVVFQLVVLAFCMRMRQYGLRFCTTCFSLNSLRSIPLFTGPFAGCFLELNDLYWVLRSTNVFFKVSRHFYDESEFVVASLSPLRGQSFIS